MSTAKKIPGSLFLFSPTCCGVLGKRSVFGTTLKLDNAPNVGFNLFANTSQHVGENKFNFIEFFFGKDATVILKT